MEVRERGCTILPDFDGHSDPDFFRNVNLPFDITNDAELERKTKVAFFQVVFQMLNRKMCLKATGSDEVNRNTICNHAAKAPCERDHRKGRVVFSTMQVFAMVAMIRYWMGIFLCFLHLLLGNLCDFLGLSTLTEELISLPICVGHLFVNDNDCRA